MLLRKGHWIGLTLSVPVCILDSDSSYLLLLKFKKKKKKVLKMNSGLSCYCTWFIRSSVSAYLPFHFHRLFEIFLCIQGLWWKKTVIVQPRVPELWLLQTAIPSHHHPQRTAIVFPLLCFLCSLAPPYKSIHCSPSSGVLSVRLGWMRNS